MLALKGKSDIGDRINTQIIQPLIMRHFATESGQSKGQFYTPADVSRVIAQVIGISPQNTKASTTAYDPTRLGLAAVESRRAVG